MLKALRDNRDGIPTRGTLTYMCACFLVAALTAFVPKAMSQAEAFVEDHLFTRQRTGSADMASDPRPAYNAVLDGISQGFPSMNETVLESGPHAGRSAFVGTNTRNTMRLELIGDPRGIEAVTIDVTPDGDGQTERTALNRIMFNVLGEQGADAVRWLDARLANPPKDIAERRFGAFVVRLSHGSAGYTIWIQYMR